MAKSKKGSVPMNAEKQRETARKESQSYAHMDQEKQRDSARKGGKSSGQARGSNE